MLKGHVFENQLFGNPIFAVFINTFLDGKNGVINGFGNGMAVTTNGFNLTIQSGVVCVQGRFLQEDTSTTITAGSTLAYARLVLEIDLDKTNTENDFQQGYYKVITNALAYPELTQDDIVNDVSGVYQFSLGRFQITSNGIVGYADERSYLDFTSIYGEISQHISAIDDEKIFVPIGGGYDYYGAEVPNENMMWADGSELSRTEYAALFAVIGTTYGEGDGSTTFNLPDKRRRHALMKGENDTLGDTGGNETLYAMANPLSNGIFYQNAHKNFSSDFEVTGYGAGVKRERTNPNQNAGIAIRGETDDSSREPYLICNYVIRVK